MDKGNRELYLQVHCVYISILDVELYSTLCISDMFREEQKPDGQKHGLTEEKGKKISLT